MKSFNDNVNTQCGNPFLNIANDQFENMLLEGFEEATLDCYAHLTGNTCYKKTFNCPIGWIVRCYITENGVAVDYDYACGGNSNNRTWWFEDGVYTINEFNYNTYDWEDVEYTKSANSFTTAWDEMIDYAKSL